MQWAFTTPSNPAGLALKRKPSNPQLTGLAAKQLRGSVVAAVAGSSATATPSVDGGGSGAAASVEVAAVEATPMAVDACASASSVEVDVEVIAAKYGWDLEARNDWQGDKQVKWVPIAAIRRPLQGSGSNDPEKVAGLMKSIEDIGLQDPIDVLEVNGQYWGFSGCHRFEAHQLLGKEQILCRVRKATPQVLRFHMM